MPKSWKKSVERDKKYSMTGDVSIMNRGCKVLWLISMCLHTCSRPEKSQGGTYTGDLLTAGTWIFINHFRSKRYMQQIFTTEERSYPSNLVKNDIKADVRKETVQDPYQISIQRNWNRSYIRKLLVNCLFFLYLFLWLQAFCKAVLILTCIFLLKYGTCISS